MPALLPGIIMSTTPTDYNPIKQMRLQRFDGKLWTVFTDVIEE
jgi:branched-chain amino acid transport system substrate-binding protein